jgi:23S rRNA (cytosine1962-C5)-methyltransferase
MVAVIVNRKAADRVASGHPWIYASDVTDRGEASPGETVVVTDPTGRTLGTAHYSSTSQITLRLLETRAETIDRAFYSRRLAAALEHRRRVVTGSDAYRLVYGEGDRLPGLIVDRYADYLAVQILDQGMDRAKEDIVDCLRELLAPAGIVARNDVARRKKEALPLEISVIAGSVPDTVEFHMNGLRMYADLLRGQKTGAFLDQRENYPAAARYASGRALDCFAGTGGFALHMAHRCDVVEAVDSSVQALAAAEINRKANDIHTVEFRQADVFDLLAGYAAADRRYSLIVLDPPAFAKGRHAVAMALRGYKEINLRALRLLDPGGILVTCSCSHHVSEASFLEIVATAALDAGRTLRVLERRTQSQDHPILLTVPETHYLKCLILQVL